jgi:hypothetical protein
LQNLILRQVFLELFPVFLAFRPSLQSKFVKCENIIKEHFLKNATWVTKTAEFDGYFEFIEKVEKNSCEKVISK